MAAEWAWAVAGSGLCTAVAMAARACAYVLREHVRGRAMASILKQLGRRSGSIEVTDREGEIVWAVRLENGEHS
ncbi:hypothetical protein [Actinacidiphila glaucinigra]|uniref:hypothetical protein n=1 Tax=Actinacidiphila glaucinigra TaxID=235986 RepID=UPI00366EC580